MKAKKGIIKEETVKIIIAVVAIVILVYLAYSLYSIVQGSKEREQADAIVKQVADKVNNMKTNEEIMTITGPRGWFLKVNNNLLCVFCKLDEKKCKGTVQENTICTNIKDGLEVEIIDGEVSIYTKDIIIKKENGKISILPR